MTISQKIKMALAYKSMSEAELARSVRIQSAYEDGKVFFRGNGEDCRSARSRVFLWLCFQGRHENLTIKKPGTVPAHYLRKGLSL